MTDYKVLANVGGIGRVPGPTDRLLGPDGAVLSGGAAGASTRVQWKTTGNIADLGAGAPLQPDGSDVAAGEFILVDSQTDPKENGIYVVTTPGTGVNGVWARATNYNQDDEVNGLISVWVEKGTAANANTFWALDRNAAVSIGVDNIVFVKKPLTLDSWEIEGTFILDGTTYTDQITLQETLPRAGYVTNTTARLLSARTAGSVGIEVAVNGSDAAMTGLDLLLDDNPTQTQSATVAYGTTGYSFAADAALGLLVKNSSDFAPAQNVLVY